MNTTGRGLAFLALVVGALAHLWGLYAPPQLGQGALKDTLGRDFASYYYAADEALAGGDPWDTAALSKRAKDDGTRRSVHPFFYPPPFVVWVAWAPSLSLERAFTLWKWLHELCVLTCIGILWRWWRPLGEIRLAAIAVAFGLGWGVHYGMAMGQANPLVLALALGGLALRSEDRPVWAGVLVGTAAMLKMSPALLVLAWALRRDWRPVAGAVAAAIAWSAISLAVVGAGLQWRFYTEILPQFGTGDYNGLVVKIGMFANHSLPNLWHQIWPGEGSALSSTAQWASTLGTLAVVAVAALATHRSSDDPWHRAARGTLWLTVALLVPVYTYEHHLVQAAPGLALLVLAVWRGVLHWAWALPVALTLVAWALPLPDLKALAWRSMTPGTPLSLLLQEAKFAGLLCVAGGLIQLARTPRSDPQT